MSTPRTSAHLPSADGPHHAPKLTMSHTTPHTTSHGWWFRAWHTTLHMLFPPHCVSCRSPLSQEYPPTLPSSSSSLDLFGLCTGCIQSVIKLETPQCSQCAHPVEREEEQPCLSCRERQPCFTKTFSLFAYAGAMRNVLHRCKLRGDQVAGKAIQTWLHRHVGTLSIPWKKYDLVSCVPLHPEKLRQRGFNQAFLLLLSLALPPTQCDPFLLDRAKKTKPLYALKAHERENQLDHAFVVRSASHRNLSQKNILLIDDVMTTGATAHHCGLALQRAGATQVDVLTLCRAIR